MIRVFVVVLIGLVVLVIGGTITLSTSAHTGVQFSPDGFQRRQFTYYEAFGMRMSATDYFNKTGNLELDLISNKWITSSGKKPKNREWVTVTHMTGGEYFESDAKILVDYLEMSNGFGAIDLDRWNQVNPGYAAVMWPEIQKAAEGNMYILVPDILHHMLDLSRQKDNPISQAWLEKTDTTDVALADLTKNQRDRRTNEQKQIGKGSLNAFLEDLYLKAGKAAQDAEDAKRARFCFEQVLRLSPTSTEAQELLDKLPAAAKEETAEDETSDAEDSSEDESEK